jgi:hypothetical protein
MVSSPRLLTTRSCLHNKYTRKNVVLSEEKHDETGAGLEHSPHNFLTQLAQQEQVLITRRATKKLCLLPYKIRLFQAVKDDNYERRLHFHIWFLQVVHDSLLDPNVLYC